MATQNEETEGKKKRKICDEEERRRKIMIYETVEVMLILGCLFSMCMSF